LFGWVFKFEPPFISCTCRLGHSYAALATLPDCSTYVLFSLFSRRWRQRERLNASMLSSLSVCVCLFVCLLPKCQKTRFSQKLSNLELRCLLTTYWKLCNWAFQTTHYWIPKIQDCNEIRLLKIDMTSFFSAEGGPIWIKFWRLVQNEMSTVMMWSKSKPDVEFQYGGRLGKFSGMSFQSHVSHCRVLPLGEFTVTIPEPHATLQGAVTCQNQRPDRATLLDVRIPSAILKIVFRHILIFFVFNAV